MRTVKRIIGAIGELAWYGAACALLAALIYAAEGDEIVRDGGLSLRQMVIVYVVVTMACGVVLGLLKPLAKGWTGRILVSILVAWPAAVVVMWFVKNRQINELNVTDYALALALAAFAGPCIAAYVHLRFRDDASKD